MIDFELLARYGPRLIDGILVTVSIVVLSILIGGVLSAPLTFMRLSRNPFVNGIAYGYTTFFRGTPLLAQTFLVYYGAGQFRPFFQDIGLWWFFRDAFNCVVFTFALNTAAYQAEILRGAIRSVARGQWEAASALGVSKAVTTYKVILPQALIVALRPYGNEIILMMKGSAVASVVTVFDLMGVTRLAFARSFDFSVYLWAAVLYLAMVESLRRVWGVLERRLTRHLKPATA
jgi:polar amino acid transport system permease protein